MWNRTIGVGFQVRCGVRQGGVLSPFLFAIYIDDIIVEMRNSGFGIRIGCIFPGCLLYADDIVLICSYGLQKLINVCEMYGNVWDIKFNPLKSQVVIFGDQQRH